MSKKLFPQVCQNYGLPIPKPEHRFHPKRRWRIDWFFQMGNKKVVLEVEGATWTSKSRHTHRGGYHKDMEKYNAMSECGIFLLRITPQQLFNKSTFELIKNTLNND